MNIKEQEKRLENIFREKNNEGFVVAITGCWGIGKTFFWNSFINEKAKAEQDRQYLPFSIREKYKNLFNKKYSYVSLFGIENLADLRAAISMNMNSNSFNENVDKNLEVPKPLKKLLSGLRDVKFNNSEYGISGSARLLESLLYQQVRDAIICFDDFERLSEKLKIQDVMGLANQLKLERKCQVILILDESKNDEKNKRKYAEYKEKLIDETIKITSVEPLIRVKAKEAEIDKQLVDLIVEFAEKLEIHNFRFFQKVIKLYKQFIEQLPNEVADSTKEIILVRILQGYLIEDFGKKYEFDWDDIKLVLEEKQVDWSERKRKTYASLKSLAYNFIASDEWLMEFKKWFDQSGEPNFTLLHDLANSTMISELNNTIKDDFHNCFEIFWGLRVDKDFPKFFYTATKAVIGLENIHNLSFALKVLEIFKEDVTLLEQDICQWIKEQKNKDRQNFYNIQDSDEIRPIFRKLIQNYQPDKENLPTLIDAIFHRYIEKAWEEKDMLSLAKAEIQEWRELLFHEISLDTRFDRYNTSYIIKKILDEQGNSDVGTKIRSLITEIYKEKAEKDPFYTEYMNYLISRLDN